MGTHSPRGHRRAPQIGGPLRPFFDTTDSHDPKPDHKTAALCKQVGRALSLALAGDCADPLLQSLLVDAVLPAPHAGHLLVRLLSRHAGPAEILPRLEAVHRLLRHRIAEFINRKRTPELSFLIIPMSPSPTPSANQEDLP